MLSSRAATARRCAILKACRSLSITQGPAIRNSGHPAPSASLPMRTRCGMKFRGSGFDLAAGDHGLPGPRLTWRAGRGQAAGLVFTGGVDKRLEKRVGREGARLELGMELAAQEPRVVANLDNLDVSAVRSVAGNREAMGH